MLRMVITVFALVGLATAQTPGIDPRGVAAESPVVIIGDVLLSTQKVIRPDKLVTEPAKSVRQPDGTYLIVELPRLSSNYLVGHIYQVRVKEDLKRDENKVQKDQVISIFAPYTLESGVAMTSGEQYVFSLAFFKPPKEDFEKTTVSDLFQPVTDPGKPFDLEGSYYQVVAERNGIVSVTPGNQRLIDEIKARVMKLH